ncbi:unnamed protein product [Caenorhabditis brenneri]
MNLLILAFVFLLAFPTVTSSEFLDSKTQSHVDYLIAQNHYMKTRNANLPLASLFRMRRVPDSPKHTCGPKFLNFVKNVCGGPCTVSTEVNLATICCHEQCGEDAVRKSCCPL